MPSQIRRIGELQKIPVPALIGSPVTVLAEEMVDEGFPGTGQFLEAAAGMVFRIVDRQPQEFQCAFEKLHCRHWPSVQGTGAFAICPRRGLCE